MVSSCPSSLRNIVHTRQAAMKVNDDSKAELCLGLIEAYVFVYRDEIKEVSTKLYMITRGTID